MGNTYADNTSLISCVAGISGGSRGRSNGRGVIICHYLLSFSCCIVQHSMHCYLTLFYVLMWTRSCCLTSMLCYLPTKHTYHSMACPKQASSLFKVKCHQVSSFNNWCGPEGGIHFVVDVYKHSPIFLYFWFLFLGLFFHNSVNGKIVFVSSAN